MLPKIGSTLKTSAEGGSSQGQQYEAPAGKPKLALVPPLPASDPKAEGQEVATMSPRDPRLLVRAFQFIGDKTFKIAHMSKEKCAEIYQAAMRLQKKFGKTSRGGIIDKKAE